MKRQEQELLREILMMHLNSELQLSQQLLQNDNELIEEISEHKNYCEKNAYNFYLNNLSEYFQSVWEYMAKTSDNQYEEALPQLMESRFQAVYADLLGDRLKIQQKNHITPFDYSKESKTFKIQSLKQQSENIKNKLEQINGELQQNNNIESKAETSRFKDTKNIYDSLYSQEKIKEAEQFTKKKRQEQIERKKKLIEIRKKEEEAIKQKQQEELAKQQEVFKTKMEEARKKNEEYHEKRDKQRQLRQKYKTQYIKVKKSLQEKPPLFQKINEVYSKRYEISEKERIKKLEEERRYSLSRLDQKELIKHEKEYEELRKQREKERKDRILLVSQEERSRAKIHSSYQLNQQKYKDEKVPDPKQIQKQHAKQYREKILQYRSIVREKFKPKIDVSKQKQLMNLIEEMQLSHKRVKKTKLQNGAILVQELRNVDPKMIGMQYLELTKQIAAKTKARRKDDPNYGQSILNASTQYKKPINYLQQIRKNRTRSQKMSFVDSKNMSYDDKVKKVLHESEKLTELAKQNEMMLKFGKFKTSEEILACKDEIDQNYIDIVNMKLKLIINQEEGEDDESD